MNNFTDEYLYTQRQLFLMLKKIDQYKKGNILLNNLLPDLGALAGAAELNDKEWYIEFNSICNSLEYAFLNAYDVNRFDYDFRIKEIKSISYFMDMLIVHIKSKIDKNISEEDVEYKY